MSDGAALWVHHIQGSPLNHAPHFKNGKKSPCIVKSFIFKEGWFLDYFGFEIVICKVQSGDIG